MNHNDYGSNCKAGCIVSCPPGNEWEQEGDRCYFFSKEEKDWFGAEEACQKRGGHLASVNNERVHNYMQSKEFKGWIGGIDVNKGKGSWNWTWTDCSEWEFNSGWASGEPRPGHEYCVEYEGRDEISDKYLWNNKACTRHVHGFVCSIPVCPGTVLNIFCVKSDILYPQKIFLKSNGMDAARMDAR